MDPLIILLILIVLVVVVGLWLMSQYNGLVKARNRYRNGFAQIDVQLKRRHDLIPNLVETAKSFMKHERETLEAVIAARNAAESARSGASPEKPESVQSLGAAEGSLGGTLGRLFALSESYPELGSNQNMLQLQEELTSTENKVGFSRQAYNDAVTAYNTKRESFPTNIFANLFNFGPAALFEVSEPGERDRVDVKFD
ncbi:LemA family protein [Roseibacillus ishigakijimensis]|uniref:LemA family protein n=1 Tax=Roseibacillus ishigakijimensis TaxID=454146 RepID=A0A934RKZ1_9BACT|nr:LemA family protein [Roseibacillus ishigakijimensis]MBK1833632.1 LemA family protein [Roseibacillus ishigakijimensis]